MAGSISPMFSNQSDKLDRYFLDNKNKLPLVYRAPKINNNLINFCVENKNQIDNDLLTYGAVLFREFNISNINDFDVFISFMIKEVTNYVGGATPRKKLSKLASTSTIFPSDQKIKLHNELSYESFIPQNLAFCCLLASDSGGQTPIANTNQILNLIDPNIIDEFEKKNGWKLIRNFGQCFGPSIKDGFGTENLQKIREDCENRNIKLEILGDKKIRTTQIRKAIHLHPITNERLWINHVSFWHSSSIPSVYFNMMSDSLTFDEFPYLILFGDGTIIPDHYVENIRQAYNKSEAIFNWQAGDILLIDNHLVAHGRKPFIGERLIAVAMG